MHGFMNFNLYRPKKVVGFVVPWEGVYHQLRNWLAPCPQFNERELFDLCYLN